ncbi:MAG: hypothetical protein J6386_00130 [Candidatus Synoicihabitans palmerolidicus]|nr:hypothetical protein [Candidatus Synoicihabitans palmerolidicus]
MRASFGSDPYTAQVLPGSDTIDPGSALIEIYDASVADLRSRLTNLSARTNLTANSEVTVGFVLDGQTPRGVLIRAVGPGLAEFGVTGTLLDPQLLLLTGSTPEVGNNDWNGSEISRAAAEQVGAFALTFDSKDAALVTTLPPGAYTARVTAPTNQSGIVLVEVYLLPDD